MVLIVSFGLILMAVVAAALFIYALYALIGCFSLAPYVATSKRLAKKMVDLGGIREGTRVVEIGSGNGTISIEAARRGATVIGIEINPILVLWADLRAWKHGVARQTHFIRGSIWSWTIPHETDVVMIYGMPNAMPKIWKMMVRDCRPGTVLVSHAFTVKEKTPIQRDGTVLIYRT